MRRIRGEWIELDSVMTNKKRLYMIQACSQQDGFFSIPYSIGVLAAYAWQNAKIEENYELCGLIGEKIDWQAHPETIVDPDVVAFSCYIWNFEYSKHLAKLIKDRYPRCVIIFGGHSIPIRNSNVLRELPCVDYVIHGEGELPLTELLLFLCGESGFEDVHNISYRTGEGTQYRYDSEHIVQDYPSPYLSGIFDRFLDFKNKRYTATLETNRGCPFHCGYCDWGLNSTKLRLMDFRKVLDEIEWMGKNRIFTCYGADSNFGMFDRDMVFAEKFVEVKKQYGYPKKFSVSFSKQSNEKVLQISKILNDGNSHAGSTLSFQSLNPQTLELIGRKNLSLEHFQDLIVKYNKYNIATYSEIILALPGETYDSFVDGLCTLVENGQYRYINVYDFALLINSEIGQPEMVNKYGIQTVAIPQRTYYCPAEDCDTGIQEISNIVVETSSMPRNDWVRCRTFTAILKNFHAYGILLYAATYLRHSANIPYRDFYEDLYRWITRKGSDSVFAVYANLQTWLEGIVYEKKVDVAPQDRYGGYRIPCDEATFLKLKERLDEVYRELEQFLEGYCSDPCWIELMRFQKTVMDLIYLPEAAEETFSYDFVSYFNGIVAGEPAELSKRPITIGKDSLRDMILHPKKIYISEKRSK